MEPATPVSTRPSRSSGPLSKSEEEIIKKLNSHPERLSSGELAKTLLRTFSKNLGNFSSATTFEVYSRWLEAQRHAPQTTINYNWKNVIIQWAQSLKARNFTLKELILEVEHWKRINGPFRDPKTEENPRYPPTIDELELAYKMDLRAHSSRKTPAAPFMKRGGDRYLPSEPRTYSEEPGRARLPINGIGLQWCQSCRTRTSSVRADEMGRLKHVREEIYFCTICGLQRDKSFELRQDGTFSSTVSLKEPRVREAASSPAKRCSSSPTITSIRTGCTIGLFVMNVGSYTNDEVIQIFHPSCRHTITLLEAWLTNRTVHFQTVEDRDQAYYLLPDNLKTRREKDLSRPLVKIYSDRGNESKSDIDSRGPSKKLQRPIELVGQEDASGDAFAAQWLDKLAEEIMERKGRGDNNCNTLDIHVQNGCAKEMKNIFKEDEPSYDNTQQQPSLFIRDARRPEAGLKRPRTPDIIAHGETCSGPKRTKHMNGPMFSFRDEQFDEDSLDCSTLDLISVKRPNALHMWDLRDKAKHRITPIKDETNNVNEENIDEAGTVNSNVDREGLDRERDARHANDEENISSPEDGWCSSRDYWAGSSGGSNYSGREEDHNIQPASPTAATVGMVESSRDLDMA